MSSIRKNEFGFWFLDLRLEGKRYRETLETKDKKLAVVRANLRLRELEIKVRYKQIGLEELFDLYLEWAKPRLAASSYRNYKSIKKRILEECSIEHVDEFSRENAEQLMMKLQGKMTARGANYYLRALRTIFQLAVEWEYIGSNPFTKVQKFKEPSIKPRIMKRSELEAFFGIVKKDFPEYYDLFLVYLLTGLRRAEALQLKQEDVDLENDTLIIHGKGDKYRLVPMLPIVREIFLKRVEMPRPFPWDGSTITHIFGKAREDAKIGEVKLHDMRKTFSTMLADQGFSSLIITQWLGHADDEVTRTHYLGHNDKLVRRQMKAFQKALLSTKLQKYLQVG